MAPRRESAAGLSFLGALGDTLFMFEFVAEEVFECGPTFEMVRIFRHRTIHEALGAGDERDLRSEFVEVQGGTFQMGAADEEVARWAEWYERKARFGEFETPRVETEVESFLLARVPATLGVWDALKKTNIDVWDQRMIEGPDLPVTGVSWQSAMVSAELLGCRLPTESEWEYAARAGTDTTFFFGSTEFDLSKYATFRAGGLSPVATKEPNAFGLYDMLGNVWEWCSDRWAESPRGHEGQRARESADSDPMLRPLRGGSYLSTVAPDLACARRDYAGVYSHADDVGLRLAADLPA